MNLKQVMILGELGPAPTPLERRSCLGSPPYF